nr:hypothetical protein CDL12_13798 [Ipomoea trifida]
MANVDTSNATDNTNAQTSEARMLADRLEVRLNRLQDSAFQVANYYFVFQGVILAAISNTSNLTCHNRYFLFTLSLLASIIDLFALFSTAMKYLETLGLRDTAWRDFNNLQRRSLAQQHPPVGDREREDCFSKMKQCIYLGILVILFLSFAGVMLGGCWNILCKHNECKRDYDCVTLCNGGRCMKICNDF